MSRMPELDFIEFIQSGPLTPEDSAEISAWIQRSRAAEAKAKIAREKLKAKALALPTAERTQLAYQLLSSLVAEESSLPERAWAATAKEQFDQLRPVQQPTRSGAKPRRRANSSTAKRQTPSASSK